MEGCPAPCKVGCGKVVSGGDATRGWKGTSIEAVASFIDYRKKRGECIAYLGLLAITWGRS